MKNKKVLIPEDLPEFQKSIDNMPLENKIYVDKMMAIAEVKNLKNKCMEQKMIEDILNKYVIEAPSMGRSVILADRIDEVAEDIRQFLLQQTPCTAKLVCPVCENPCPHSHTDGAHSCEDCGHTWAN